MVYLSIIQLLSPVYVFVPSVLRLNKLPVTFLLLRRSAWTLAVDGQMKIPQPSNEDTKILSHNRSKSACKFCVHPQSLEGKLLVFVFISIIPLVSAYSGVMVPRNDADENNRPSQGEHRSGRVGPSCETDCVKGGACGEPLSDSLRGGGKNVHGCAGKRKNWTACMVTEAFCFVKSIACFMARYFYCSFVLALT